MMNRTVLTPHGLVAMARGLVSLTDIWNNSGRHKLGFNPQQWCRAHDVKWHGDIDEVFVDSETAVKYARAVDSDVMANIIQAELNVAKPPMHSADMPYSKEAADSSRAMLLSAFKAAGITQKKQIIQLTNALYVAVLGKTAAGLAQTYKCGERSIRRSLDNESLLKLLTAEMHIISYVYSEQITGLSQALTKIKHIGELVNQLSQVKH